MLNGNELGQRIIQELNIPEQAQPNIIKLANVIVNYFKENAEVNIEEVFMQVDNVLAGSETRAVRKFNQRGKIE